MRGTSDASAPGRRSTVSGTHQISNACSAKTAIRTT
jgi:hypothetical protein